jgi:hypothetical protein
VWREHYLAEMWVGKAVAEGFSSIREGQEDHPESHRRHEGRRSAEIHSGQTEKRETRLFVVAGDRSRNRFLPRLFLLGMTKITKVPDAINFASAN